MGWFEKTEREKWATPLASTRLQDYRGLPALDAREQALYGRMLPRNVSVPRFMPDRPPVNFWMPPYQLLQHGYVPGQIILGKFGGRYLGHLDDRPMVTIAGARAGKTSTILEPNLCLYPGSMLVLDPKCELASLANIRRALGHNVLVLDPFGQSGQRSACFNALAELDPDSRTIVDDAAAITHAIIVDEGDARSKHWNDSARALLLGIILLALTRRADDRNLITVRQLLTLTYPPLVSAIRARKQVAENGTYDAQHFSENAVAVQALLLAMSRAGDRFGGVLASIGNRFLSTPPTERGSIFSTAAAQTDFLDSLPLREISRQSDFTLADLRGGRPMTIFLCLPVGRMASHYRWLRLVVQMTCLVLEQLGAYPRHCPPILFMMEEFAVLGHMEIMERAAAYFPSFGIKLWSVLQDITQLRRYYSNSFETFLGNAGLVQCFANGDEATLQYLSQRLEKLMLPFELRNAFSRQSFNQLLLMEGEAPAAATRLEHGDVAAIHAHVRQWAATMRRQLR